MKLALVAVWLIFHSYFLASSKNKVVEHGPIRILWNFSRSQTDVLIADLSMPNVDGYELLRTVRSSHLADALAGTYSIGSKTGSCAVAAWLLCISDCLA